MTRIGIVGGGIRGQLFHRALDGFENVTVSGILDNSERVREGARRELGVTTWTSLDDLVSASDGVIIATPDFAHFDAAVHLIRAGTPTLVEKPLTTSVPEARELARLAASHGTEVFVGFENRWANTFRQAESAISAGKIGSVTSIHGRLSDQRSVPLSMISWAHRSSPAWFLMPHTLDVALWLSGSRVESVVADGTRGVLDGLGVHTWDSVSAIFRLENGARVMLDSSWALPKGNPSLVDFRIEIFGSDGTVVVDNTSQMLQVITDEVDYPRTLGSFNAGRLHGPAPWMVQTFARRVAGEQESLPSLAEGVHVTEAIAAVHESLDNGRRVHIQEVSS